jgi:hypothetical protein
MRPPGGSKGPGRSDATQSAASAAWRRAVPPGARLSPLPRRGPCRCQPPGAPRWRASCSGCAAVTRPRWCKSTPTRATARAGTAASRTARRVRHAAVPESWHTSRSRAAPPALLTPPGPPSPCLRSDVPARDLPSRPDRSVARGGGRAARRRHARAPPLPVHHRARGAGLDRAGAPRRERSGRALARALGRSSALRASRRASAWHNVRPQR